MRDRAWPWGEDFERFIRARHELMFGLSKVNYGDELKVILSPRYEAKIRASAGVCSNSVIGPGVITGLPYTVSRDLPPGHLGVIFCGQEPFDPQHPERTVVIKEAETAE